jgi:Domain of unknown function (DUF4388)/Bacterial SH3 domain
MRIVQLRLLSIFLLLVTSLTLSADKQIEVTNFYAKLYLAPSINAKFMGLAQRGERYSILLGSNYWYRIDFKGVPVWIQKSDIQLIDPNAPPSENPPVAANNASPPQETEPSTTVTNTEPQQPRDVPAQPQATPGAQQPTSRSTITDEQIRAMEARAAEMRRARIQDSIEEVAKEKRELSRLNFSKLPVIEQNVEEQQTDKVFLITVSPSKVLSELSPTSPILGIVSKGDKLQLIGEGESWCKVMYKGSTGWIEKRSGKVIIPGTAGSFFEENRDILLLSVVILIAFLVLVIVLIISLRVKKKRLHGNKTVAADAKKVLVIAKELKYVSNTFTSTSVPIGRSYNEIGFHAKFTHDTQNLSSVIDNYNPDIIMIDWNLDKTISNTVERILLAGNNAISTLVVVYNVPDPSSMFPSPKLHMSFLGISITDKDLTKIVKQLEFVNDKTATDSGSKESESSTAALEGEIAGSNLSEVMQYIEAGQKTGCLVIAIGNPVCLIYFSDGRISYAATADGLVAKDALFAALELKKGNFRFLLNKKPKAANTNMSTLEVLMSWTKEIDEASKPRLRTP